MQHPILPYDAERDFDAVARIWLEIGWLESEKKEALRRFLLEGNAEVAHMRGEAECMVHWTPGSIRYQETDLGMCAVTAVTTSQIARKHRFASQMTARALAQGAAEGHSVAVLGMFEQGFYDRLGFGTGAYDNKIQFDPANLLVDHIPYRVPERIPLDAGHDLQQAMARRLRSHGGAVLDPPGQIVADIGFSDKVFALGYRDESGQLTHFVLGSMPDGHGPWEIRFLAFRSGDQLLELLRLLHELSDQIRTVNLIEPAEVQLQVLLKEPMRERHRSTGSGHESFSRSSAWWQIRILDLTECVAARSWSGRPVAFNLTLTDPVSDHLGAADGDGWRGVGGEYTVEIGVTSKAMRGHSEGLPLVRAGVGAFTRLWFGVRQTTVLAVTDDISAPQELLSSLDDALCLPTPILGWDF